MEQEDYLNEVLHISTQIAKWTDAITDYQRQKGY
jgi:hypothetical protein